MTMKKTHVADWTDAFLSRGADSSLPTDDLTPSNGTTFGLDSFDFDEQDNAGAEDAARLPETRGLSQLPDGFTNTADVELPPSLDDDDGIILSDDDFGLDKDASLVNLEWLDPTQPQDPNRLPNSEATLDVIPELEAAWASEAATDGVYRIPAQDLEAVQYQDAVRDTGGSQLPGVKNASDEEVRDAAFRAVRRAHFGHPPDRIKEALVEDLGHDAARTKAIVAAIEAEHGLMGNVYVRAAAFPGIKNGQWIKELRRSCRLARYVITDDPTVATKLGMKLVKEVPWKAALEHYRPMLAAEGYRLASGDPKEALRRAFLSGPKIKAATESYKPVEKHVEATETEATEALAAVAPPTAPKTAEEKAEASKRKVALTKMAHWVKEGRLDKDAAVKLHLSGADSYTLLKQATELMRKGSEATYTGAGEFATDARQERLAKQEKVPEQTQRLLQAANASGMAVAEIRGLLRWARQCMTEGGAGREFTSELEARFSPPLIKAASTMLAELRERHEGLSGHLYVDAAAYASPEGATGCEKNASKHRANGIKLVLAMPRCATCVHKNPNGVCSTYNKRLATKLPVLDPKAYQREMIRQANSTDAEQTADLFNPAEFSLHNGALDDFTIGDAPTTQIAEAVFGGMEVELKE
jgi:hypothetical protein